MSTTDLKRVFGHRVRLGGRYEVNPDGRPRLFYVDRIEKVFDNTQQESLPI